MLRLCKLYHTPKTASRTAELEESGISAPEFSAPVFFRPRIFRPRVFLPQPLSEIILPPYRCPCVLNYTVTKSDVNNAAFSVQPLYLPKTNVTIKFAKMSLRKGQEIDSGKDTIT